MKKYSVSMVRERLAEALDEADLGHPVIIERKGVRYRLSVDRTSRRKSRRFEVKILNPAILDGQWTWDWTPGGLQFRDRHKS
jgi:hypothetical protein